MGARKAQPGRPLRRLVGFHVMAQLPGNGANVRAGVRNSGNGFVADGQLLSSAGAFPVVDGGVFL